MLGPAGLDVREAQQGWGGPRPREAGGRSRELLLAMARWLFWPAPSISSLMQCAFLFRWAVFVVRLPAPVCFALFCVALFSLAFLSCDMRALLSMALPWLVLLRCDVFCLVRFAVYCQALRCVALCCLAVFWVVLLGCDLELSGLSWVF